MRKVKIPPRLWNAIGALELAGQNLANIAYNLAQGVELTRSGRAMLDDLRKEWDSAEDAISQLL